MLNLKMALMQNLRKLIEEDLFPPQYFYDTTKGFPEATFGGQYAAPPVTVSLRH